MMHATFKKHTLHFKRPAGTSRGILQTKETYILQIEESGKYGVGECGLFKGLSFDDVPQYEQKLQWLCDNINRDAEFLYLNLKKFPSIWFGYEQATRNLKYSSDIYFPSDFTDGKTSILINGLIWMGDTSYMRKQIQDKIKHNFHCIKLKIGVDWPKEHQILQELRKDFPREKLELRVDANGAFTKSEAHTVLEQLKDLEIHSIEQPIKAGKTDEMAELCADTPTPIALDEELIGILERDRKRELLEKIRPQYIILKPSLVGGVQGTDEWIQSAEENNIGWWITSALESNIGLNAIAQYTFTKKPNIPQGLGTGSLFSNNFPSALKLIGEQLWKV